MAEPSKLPQLDINDQMLVRHVHPADWVNPTPATKYHLVVVGAGTAGLIAASFAAAAGARVALVERHLMGGDCLNVGCIPSKSLLRSSRVYAELRDAAVLGWRVPDGYEVDFGAVMKRLRQIRTRISPKDSAARYRDEKGIDVFLGPGRFTSGTTLDVCGASLRFRRAVIATGAVAARLPIPGLAEVGYLTNETVFNLTTRPSRLAVVGGGPAGAELAQAFRRLGSDVTLLEKADHILGFEDPDAAAVLEDELERDGVRVEVGCHVDRVECQKGDKVIHFSCGKKPALRVDEILVTAGRVANTDGLGLEAAGVNYSQEGVTVNESLQTSNPRVYAAGDVCLAWKFTHAAEAAAQLAVQNALFPVRRRLSALTIPWCIYTDPEVAHVGISSHQARAREGQVVTYTHHLRDVDRAVTDGKEIGFVRIHTRKGSDEILGATIVAAHAGEMISEVTLAMGAHLGLRKLATVVHPYPTYADALRRVALQHTVSRVTPLVRRLLRFWFKLTG